MSKKALLIIGRNPDIARHLKEVLFQKEVSLEDVILLENLENLDNLKSRLQEHSGEFDRIAIITPGEKTLIPKIKLNSRGSAIPYTEVIKEINEVCDGVEVIDATFDHSKNNFDVISSSKKGKPYYKKLNESLAPGQVLLLHGDENAGQHYNVEHLRRFILNRNSSIGDVVLNSVESINAVEKVKDGSHLESFTYHPSSHSENLKNALIRANEFEEKLGHVTSNSALETFKSWGEKEFREYSQKIFLRDFRKAITHSNEALLEKSKARIRSRRVNLNVLDDSGMNPLMLSVNMGNEDMVKTLLEEGAAPNIKSTFEDTRALDLAILHINKDNLKNREKFIRIIGCLLDHGAKNFVKDFKWGINGIERLMLKEDIEVLDEFIKRDKNVMNLPQGVYGNSMFMMSLSRDQGRVRDYLIEKGADINQKLKDGDTPLIYMIKRNNLKGAKCLIEKGEI